MNALSLVLNGRTSASISQLPEKQAVSITTLSPRAPSSPSLSGRSTPGRPGHSRQTSRDSPGWYNTDGGLTLDDFARRLNTTTKRIERWQGACAQNVVMALMRPTPIVLFLFNPVSLLLWILVGLWWMSGGREG